MLKIVTAQEVLGTRTAKDYRRWYMRQEFIKLREVQLGVKLSNHSFLDYALLASTVIPQVNHGRWIGVCPNPFCASAMVLHKESHFICPSCLNLDIGVCARIVAWPSSNQIQEIERLLSIRPLPEFANYLPGELISDLVQENLSHGLAA